MSSGIILNLQSRVFKPLTAILYDLILNKISVNYHVHTLGGILLRIKWITMMSSQKKLDLLWCRLWSLFLGRDTLITDGLSVTYQNFYHSSCENAPPTHTHTQAQTVFMRTHFITLTFSLTDAELRLGMTHSLIALDLPLMGFIVILLSQEWDTIRSRGSVSPREQSWMSPLSAWLHPV